MKPLSTPASRARNGGRPEMSRVAHAVLGSAVHLRRAAQRVRVLHLLAVDVARQDGAALQQRAQVGGGRQLARLRADRVDAFLERRRAAAQRLDRQRAADVGGLGEPDRLEDGEAPDRGHDLRAVDQREALLLAQQQRLAPHRRERLRAGHLLAVGGEHLAAADQRQGHVAQRREVAAGADRSLRWDHRREAGVEQRQRLLQQLEPHTGEAEREVVDAQRERQPARRERQRLADAGGVAEQQVGLQRRQLVVGDAHAGELPEAGVDAVHRAAGGDRVLHDLAARAHALHRGRRQRRLGAGTAQLHEGREREVRFAKSDRGHGANLAAPAKAGKRRRIAAQLDADSSASGGALGTRKKRPIATAKRLPSSRSYR